MQSLLSPKNNCSNIRIRLVAIISRSRIYYTIVYYSNIGERCFRAFCATGVGTNMIQNGWFSN